MDHLQEYGDNNKMNDCKLQYTAGCTNKNNPLEKMLYFSHDSTDLNQTFRLCM